MGIFMPSSTLGDAREGLLELISPVCTPRSRWIRFAMNLEGRLTCGYWPTTIETRNKYWHWCSSLCHGATSATLWRLCLVDALLVKRSTKVLCWVDEFCLYCLPPPRGFLLERRWMVPSGTRMRHRVLLFARRDIVVFGMLWSECLMPPFVPIRVCLADGHKAAGHVQLWGEVEMRKGLGVSTSTLFLVEGLVVVRPL